VKVRATSEELTIEVDQPGIRQAAVVWGGVRVSLELLAADAQLGRDPVGRCPCPHWGWLRAGRLRVSYPDHDELICAGDLYFAAPGHTVVVEQDCDVLEMSPADGGGTCSLAPPPSH
jgi:hypothetical protein